MLDSKRSQLTQSILGRLKKKGVPTIGPIDLVPEMDQGPDGEILDQELNAMSSQVQAAPGGPILSQLRKRKPKRIPASVDEEVYE